MSEMKTALKFGDEFVNPWASEQNPTRIGYFVRRGNRTGNLNRGPYCEFTDKRGKFWTMAAKDVDDALAKARGDHAQAL